ncbi:hypothetical protein QBC39DRAFT_338069 [Podospora conica]|nr:hypothetical protein QBC39DRAFT_338069 [Schizothecium conicum]
MDHPESLLISSTIEEQCPLFSSDLNLPNAGLSLDIPSRASQEQAINSSEVTEARKMKKFSCSSLLLPVALVLHGGLTAFQMIMLRAGTGSIDNHDHLPNWYNWYMVIIDTDKFVSTVDRQDDDLHGLPDTHDSSKRKDFYAIYPSLYCSGKKENNVYKADYCSPWGTQFDLHWLWRVWGMDLIHNNYIGYRPKTIFYSLITGTSGTVLSLAGCFISIFSSYWGRIVTCITSWISLVALIAMSVTSQQFISKLANNVHHVQPTSGTGSISARAGPVHMRCAWILTVTALVDALLITFIVWRSHKRRAEKRDKKHAGPEGGGGVFGAGGRFGGVYQFLVPGGKESRAMHGGSHVELMTAGGSRVASPAGWKAMAVGSVTERASAYEPMRHR